MPIPKDFYAYWQSPERLYLCVLCSKVNVSLCLPGIIIATCARVWLSHSIHLNTHTYTHTIIDAEECLYRYLWNTIHIKI